jgi:putative heme-binding domain-containing protein
MATTMRSLTLFALAICSPASARAQKVVPAANIQIRTGFLVERVYQVKGATEGSWVAMCFDDKGRIYASSEGNHGLFRISPPPIGAGGECGVELVSNKWGRCQGMAWVDGSLYVVQHETRPKGGSKEKDLDPDAILRLRDTDGDDKLDSAERLFVFPKVTGDKRPWYEHHIHGIVRGPDGKSIYVISGDRNMPPCEKSRVAKHWNRDSWEFKSIPSPFSGGWVLRTDLDGRNPEYLCMGLRNGYDIAFNRRGDLFTFDSDLEYDIGMPNYRPTAIRQILSGTDSGWAGSGPAMQWSWTPKWEDIQPPIQNIGPGSPTGVCFGYGAKFPARYQEALFACDWTFGRIFAIHLTPKGATYEAEVELFLSSKGMPVTDLAVSPKDGALYFTTGGRGAGSNLYRVIYRGAESTAPSAEKPMDPAAAALHKLRRELEVFHGETNPRTVAAVWQHLGHEDRAIRGAARAALEWQPAPEWKQKALEEKQPRVALQALLALSRSTDGDKTIQPALLAALDRFDFAQLGTDEQSWYLRILTISASRHGMFSKENAARIEQKLAKTFPSADRRVNEDLAAMFVALGCAGSIASTLDLFERSPSQEEQIHYASVLLRDPKSRDWTPVLGERFFALAAERLPRWKGGAFVNPKREAVLKGVVAMLDDEQRKKNSERIAALQKPSIVVAEKKRDFVKQWKLEDLVASLETGLKEKRDLENGRALYTAAKCFTCHSFQGDGGFAGPDLTNVRGRSTAAELLDKILNPSRKINEQYGRLVYELKNGKQIVGRVVETSDDAIIVGTNPENPFAGHVRFSKKDVESVVPSRVSAMPEDLLNTLTRDDVLDLLAYLLNR